MHHTIVDIGVARQIANYSDAVEVRPNLRWLYTSGTPGFPRTATCPETSRAKRNGPGSMLFAC